MIFWFIIIFYLYFCYKFCVTCICTIISYIVGIEPDCSPEVEVHNIFCEEDSSGVAIVTKHNNAYNMIKQNYVVLVFLNYVVQMDKNYV